MSALVAYNKAMTQPPPAQRTPNSDGEALDVGSWTMTLVRSWWLILALVVLGGLVGAALTLISADRYSATASVYIGQTTDANGNPMTGLNSNARAVTQLLASDGVLKEAARRAGMGWTAGQLGRQTAVDTPSSSVRTTTSVVNIAVISVTDEDAERAAAAANSMAEVLLEDISEGVDEKIATLEKQLEEGRAASAAAAERSRAAQTALRSLARQNGGQADNGESAPYVAVVQAAASEQQAIQASNQKLELMLLTVHQVERPRILHDADVPTEPQSSGMGVNVAAGALAGLVVGIVLAFVRRRVGERGKGADAPS